jgi:replicative DNA helicase
VDVTAPPHDLDAERALLSAAMFDPDAVVPLIDALPADALYHPAHVLIAQAILRLVDDGVHPDAVTVNARLEQNGVADRAGHVLLDVATAAGIPTAAPGYVAVIRDHHARRATIALGYELQHAGRLGDHAAVASLLERAAVDTSVDQSPASVPGDQWVLDAPPGVPVVWGRDGEVLWAEGEALVLAGPAGVGKTTVTGQVVAARIGLLDEVLGFPVAPTGSRLLWLAMDRPQQIRRAFARLVGPEHRDLLRNRLRARPGPPPYGPRPTPRGAGPPRPPGRRRHRGAGQPEGRRPGPGRRRGGRRA